MSKPDWIDETQRPGDWIDEKFVPGAEQKAPEKKAPEKREEERHTMNNTERRVFASDEVRAEQGTSGDKHLIGYALRFNRLSSILRNGRVGTFRERVLPGATRTIAKGGYRGVMALWNHNADFPLASADNGSLQLAEDAKGLRYNIRVDPNVSYANDLWQNCRSGTVKGSSFGFAALDPNSEDDSWKLENRDDFEDELDDDELDAEDRSKKCVVRTIRNIRKLLDVSPCCFPAYNSSSVEARSQNVVLATVPDNLEYTPWLVEAQRRSDAIAKMIASESVTDDSETVRRRRRTLLNGCLS